MGIIETTRPLPRPTVGRALNRGDGPLGWSAAWLGLALGLAACGADPAGIRADVSPDGTTAPDPSCATWVPAEACPLGGAAWVTQTRPLAELVAPGYPHPEVSLGAEGTLCALIHGQQSVEIWCWAAASTEPTLRTRRDILAHEWLGPLLRVDREGRAHLVWATTAGDEQGAHYAVDDAPAETIAVDALGALDALHVDPSGEVVVAFARGGARGPNRHFGLPFAFRVATRAVTGGWDVRDYDVPERASAGWIAARGPTRWFVWRRAWADSVETEPWAVDLATGAEVALAPDDAPGAFRPLTGWVGGPTELHLLGIRGGLVLVHRTLTREGGEDAWVERVVVESREGRLEGGDVFIGPSTVRDDLKLTVGVDGTAHLWVWREESTSGFELVHAHWAGGPTWTRDTLETIWTPTPDAPTIYGLSYVQAFAAGRDGTLRAVVPGVLKDAPSEKVFVTLVGEHCAARCAD